MLPPLTDLEGQPGALGRHARDAISKLQELGMEEDLDKSVTSLINYLQPAARERASLAVALQALTELRCSTAMGCQTAWINCHRSLISPAQLFPCILVVCSATQPLRAQLRHEATRAKDCTR